MPGLTEAHYRALSTILRRLEPRPDIVWALTGSTSFALQGMKVEAHDIDIMTDAAGARAMGELLGDFCVKPVAPSSAEFIRSHYGQFLVDGVEVDLMGDSSRLGLDGVWTAPRRVGPLRFFVSARGMRLPVIALRHEVQAYRELRRPGRVAQIEQFLWNGSE